MPTVRCINNNEGGQAITVGQQYIAEEGDTCYTLTNDQGNVRPYLKSHFEVVSNNLNPSPVPVVSTPEPVVPSVMSRVVNDSHPQRAANSTPSSRVPLVALVNGDTSRFYFADSTDAMRTTLETALNNGAFTHGETIAIYNLALSRTLNVIMHPELREA
jgi:hypothetical protein